MTCDLPNPIFTNETKAIEHSEASRWPNGVICPLCGSVDGPHKMAGKTQAGMFLCNDCRGKFTVRTGTVLERSHIPLHKWLLATHLMASSKKGISAHQLHRMLGITYKTAWFMAHRIREAMKEPTPAPQIGSEGKIVEADETFIGNKRDVKKKRGGSAHKNVVLSLVERGGPVRSFHLTGIEQPLIYKIILENVKREGTALRTDTAGWYRAKGIFPDHETVDHSIKEYVRGDAHTNTLVDKF